MMTSSDIHAARQEEAADAMGAWAESRAMQPTPDPRQMSEAEAIRACNDTVRRVFRRYTGRDIGQGAWTVDHDLRQEQEIGVLVDAWREAFGDDEAIGWDAAMSAARQIPGYDVNRTYIEDVRIAYNWVITHPLYRTEDDNGDPIEICPKCGENRLAYLMNTDGAGHQFTCWTCDHVYYL